MMVRAWLIRWVASSSALAGDVLEAEIESAFRSSAIMIRSLGSGGPVRRASWRVTKMFWRKIWCKRRVWWERM